MKRGRESERGAKGVDEGRERGREGGLKIKRNKMTSVAEGKRTRFARPSSNVNIIIFIAHTDIFVFCANVARLFF